MWRAHGENSLLNCIMSEWINPSPAHLSSTWSGFLGEVLALKEVMQTYLRWKMLKYTEDNIARPYKEKSLALKAVFLPLQFVEGGKKPREQNIFLQLVQ